MDRDNEKNKGYSGKKPFEKKTYDKKPREFGAKREGKPFDKKPREFDKKSEGKSFDRKPREFDKKNEGKPFDRKPRDFDKKNEGKPFDRKPREVDKKNDSKSFDRKPREAKNGKGSGMDARRVALNALADVNRVDAYASLALDKRLREATLSPEDRRLATNIFYQAVENKLYIEYVLKDFVKVKPEPVVEDILHIACAQILFMDRIPDHAAVDEAVKQTRAFGREEASGFVNGVLRSLLRAIEADEIKLPDTEAEPVKYLSVRYSVPETVIDRLIQAYGFETAAEIVSYRPMERLETVRPNLMKTDYVSFESFMDRRGWSWRKGTVDGAYLIERAGNLAGDPDFYDGLFSIQGESSMLSARAVEAKPGMTILDACAAPGGKSALMCEMMRGTGRVHAWDVHEHRVDLIKAMGKRLKLDNLRPAARDASVLREELMGAMDAVLIDAPCSGLGVMTDKPDLKYRVTDESITSLIQMQKKILGACASYVKRGGLLVYSTCSILPEENEKQIEAFLLSHPEFKMETKDTYLPDSLKPRLQNGMLSLIQSRDGVEGFFIARMRRTDL